MYDKPGAKQSKPTVQKLKADEMPVQKQVEQPKQAIGSTGG